MTAPTRGLAITTLGLWLALPAGPACGELIEVRQLAGGMECAECAHNLRVEAARLEGAIASEASWNRRILTVRFRADNRVTLEDLRALVRRHHFTVGEAEILVRGRVARSATGRWRLRVAGSSDAYDVEAADASSGASLAARLDRIAASHDQALITVRGRIAGDPAPASQEAPRLWILEIVSADPAI